MRISSLGSFFRHEKLGELAHATADISLHIIESTAKVEQQLFQNIKS